MDAHLFRLNQMSNQQLMNNRNNRNHYSNRQQAAQQQQRLHQQQNIQPTSQDLITSSSSGGGSASENDDLHQLSSISTKTSSSQQAMLAPNKQSPQQHHMMHHQRHQRQMGPQVAHHHMTNHSHSHKQAALQAQSLAASGKQQQVPSSYHNKSSANDNMTTSSSSDHTIDDLRQLATGHGPYGSRLTASRYSADAASGSSKSQAGGRFLLGILFTLAELLLFATILLWLYWSFQHDDGLSWQSDRKQQFNTHAALMLLGFIFLNGQAMLIYRSFQCCSKIYTKILHTILFVLATSAISLGLILGYTAQENVGVNSKPIMHFYSLHAWIGLTTVGLFALQFVFGFVSFLILLCCDRATSKFRAALLPVHKTFGLIIFSLAIATCLTGLLQTARSRLSSKLNKIDYHELGEAGIVINLIGVCLICLAILLPYIIRNLDIKRPFRSELDRHLKLSQLDMRI